MHEALKGLAVCDMFTDPNSPPTPYLNQLAVKEALHVKTDLDWHDCSYVGYISTRTNLPRDTYPYLIDNSIDVVIYNGDVDGQ